MSRALTKTSSRKSRTDNDAAPSKCIWELAQETQQIVLRVVKEYTPLVDAIVHSGCRDSRHIEYALDGLLDFCFDANVLILYKKLCRYYYGIDPLATASYVQLYREMWDSKKRR